MNFSTPPTDGPGFLNPQARTWPPALTRLAMKVSRSRWYSFVGRLHLHYQNGSGGANPFDTKLWMWMEVLALTVQMIVTGYTLIVSRGERPVWPMRLWVSGYAFGCFLSLMLLGFRYRHIYPTPGFDVERQGSHEESRLWQWAQRCRAWLDLVFAILFVMGNVWVFDSRLSSSSYRRRRAPSLHALCISILAWNAITYSFPFTLFLLLCCCVPLLRCNINSAFPRGATADQLARLPTLHYNDLSNQPLECCICLAVYREKEEIRELPCAHIFHLKCVDQWLFILSSCPLCKQWIE